MISGTYCGQSQAILPFGMSLMMCGSNADVQTISIEAQQDKKVIGVNLVREMTEITTKIAADR